MPTGQYTDADTAAASVQAGRYTDADVLPEQSVGAAAGEFAHQMNPVSIAKGIWQTVRHPIDTAKAYLDAKQKMVSDAEESLSKGDWPGFVRHMQTAALPLPGVDVAVEQASNKWDAGDKAGALGDAAALVSQLAITPRVPGAVKAVGRGIAAGGPDVAAGAAKVIGGEALAKLPGMEFPARIAMGYPGARQIARGLGKGAIAAFGGGTTEAPAEAAAATAAAPVAETAAAKTPGQLLAEQDGKTWAKVPKAEKQLYEQIATERARGEANVAAEGPNIPKPPRNFEEHYGVPATQQAVPRGTTPQPAAEAPPESPTQSAPTVSAQPAPAATQTGPYPSSAEKPTELFSFDNRNGGKTIVAVDKTRTTQGYTEFDKPGLPENRLDVHKLQPGKITDKIQGYPNEDWMATLADHGYEPKDVVGYVDFNPNKAGDTITPGMAYVHPDFRRVGVATSMYDLGKSQFPEGAKLGTSVGSSPYGKAFRQAYGQPAPATNVQPIRPEQQTAGDIAIAKNANAKADRIVDAIRQFGEEYTAAHPEQPFTTENVAKYNQSQQANLVGLLKKHGYLRNSEKFPDLSWPYIVTKLRQLEYTRR